MRESDRLEVLEGQIKILREAVQQLADRVIELESRELQRLEREIDESAHRFKRITITSPPKGRWQRIKDWLVQTDPDAQEAKKHG